MEIDELKYFVEAAKEQNLSRAARILGITQSTLSHAVNRLESEFGCRLFQKKGRHLQLTAQGKHFALKAKTVISQFYSLKGEMSADEAPLLGEYRIGAAPGEPLRLLARAWNRLQYRDDAVLELIGARSAQILEQVSTKKLEFGLCFCPQSYPSIIATPIASSEVVATVRKEHPILRVSRPKRLEALSRYPLATPKHLPGTDACLAHPIFKKIVSAPTIRFYYDSYDAAAEILLSSNAWGILPRAEITRHSGALLTVADKITEPIVLSLVQHEENEHSNVSEKLKKALTDVMSETAWKTLL